MASVDTERQAHDELAEIRATLFLLSGKIRADSSGTVMRGQLAAADLILDNVQSHLHDRIERY